VTDQKHNVRRRVLFLAAFSVCPAVQASPKNQSNFVREPAPKSTVDVDRHAGALAHFNPHTIDAWDLPLAVGGGAASLGHDGREYHLSKASVYRYLGD
jgi:hypothetical protein